MSADNNSEGKRYFDAFWRQAMTGEADADAELMALVEILEAEWLASEDMVRFVRDALNGADPVADLYSDFLHAGTMEHSHVMPELLQPGSGDIRNAFVMIDPQMSFVDAMHDLVVPPADLKDFGVRRRSSGERSFIIPNDSGLPTDRYSFRDLIKLYEDPALSSGGFRIFGDSDGKSLFDNWTSAVGDTPADPTQRKFTQEANAYQRIRAQQDEAEVTDIDVLIHRYWDI